MTTDVVEHGAARVSTARLPRNVTLALRDLRGGLSSFYVFLACIALGVCVISGIGALTDALRGGLSRQGQELLGGDVSLARMHTRATDTERAWLEARGTVTEGATMRAMSRRLDNAAQALIEIKAVDGAYPLYGNVELEGSGDLGTAIANRSAVVDPQLLARLDLKLGDTLRVGTQDIRIAAILRREPDLVGARLPFGPRVLVSLGTLEATGLVQPGSLVRWSYQLKLPSQSSVDALAAFKPALDAALPNSGFIIADRRDPSPAVTRSIERLRQFLTLIGLTSLLVGGVGVASAVNTFVDRKRKVIAIYKSLGATNRTVHAIFLIEILAVAALGILIGLAAGYLFPPLARALVGDTLPIRLDITVEPLSLLTAAVYGLLVALAFVLWPLGRAEQVSASVLFRDEAASDQRPPRRAMLASLVIGLLLVAMAVLTSDAKLMALWFSLGTVAVLGIFACLGTGVARVAARAPRPKRPELALALGNISGPGSLSRPVVLSLGAGLSLLVAVGLVASSIAAEFIERRPANAPAYYMLDITKAEWPAFAQMVTNEAPGARLSEAPMLRGRVVSLAGTPVEKLRSVPPEAQWVVNGDRGVTFASDVPAGSRLVEGTWWPKDYDGEPLVSFEVELAKKLGLRIGDSITVNVLGRDITARIANLREIKWENLTINFVIVFSPNTLSTAPYNLLATIALPEGTSAAEDARLIQKLTVAFPTATSVRVKDALETFGRIFEKIMVAVNVAGGVTLLSGALVLAGALATAQRRRIYQAVVLKTLGATRRRILAANLAEYALLASATGIIAALVGSVAAWIVVTRLMDLEFAFSVTALLRALALALGLVLVFGLTGTWRALSARPVPYLRAE